MKYFFIFLLPILVGAQQDTITLPDVVVTDYRLDKNQTQFVWELNDSTIQHNPPLLTEILNYNTPIYFKENGYGMVSSPSFRGTTASQTAVLWNGIKINSGFLGQTDFNTVSSLAYDEISIKAGGGSVAYGSGAIGGSIHLNHKIAYNQGFTTQSRLGYGSYNTFQAYGKVNYSTPKVVYQLSYNRNSSDNDYRVDELNYKNINGQFWNHTFNANFSYKFNQLNQLSIFLEAYQDDRHFSLIEPTASKTKYKNRNFRSLVQLNNKTGKLSSIVRLAWLNEKWQYFQNLQDDYFSMGDLSTFITKYDATYHITQDIDASVIGEISLANAVGDGSGIKHITKHYGHAGFMFSHRLAHQFSYELGVRQELNKDYKSPWLFSLGANYKPVDWYDLKMNISKNFRAPTFNDLYWEPGGNLDLKAENSLQFELSHSFKFKQNLIGLNLYYYQIKDMIRWLPGPSGDWEPTNTDKVHSSGIELFSKLQHHFGSHTVKLTNSYAYTHSINAETEKKLFYVPRHKLNGTFTYGYRNLSIYLQGLYVGEIFTTSDENPAYTNDSYQVFNTGCHYTWGKDYRFTLGFNVKNVFDNAYQAYPYRIMPPRNYNVELITKF